MRTLLAPWALLLALGGCQCLDKVCAPDATTACPEVRVKAPPQRVVVTLPNQEAAPVEAPPAPAAAPPTAPPAYSAMPPPYAYAPAPAAAPPANIVTNTVQSVSAPRARLAVGLDVIRIPIPFPRFFAVPGDQEIVTRQTQQMAPPPAYAPPMAYPASQMMAAPQAAPPAAPAWYAVQVATPQRAAAPPACPPAAPPPAAACPPGAAEEIEQLKRRLDALQKMAQERGPACP